jgi:precorrin-6B methylase 2
MRLSRHLFLLLLVLGSISVLPAFAQATAKPYEPTVGQPGKDVVWVPSPEEMVEKALDLAAVTPNDFVIDLGSGDGRNVIAAAKRGARALGVEYNPDLVQFSKDHAAKAGVADKASFVQGDMFEADISKATVMALFLLPDNLRKLRDKLFNLRPGSRIVANTFGIEGWTPDETKVYEEGCASWCTIMLWIVPAKVAGTWKTPAGDLALTQDFQMLSGTLGSTRIENGRLRGNDMTFTAGGVSYAGRVNGDTIEGLAGDRKWTAKR